MLALAQVLLCQRRYTTAFDPSGYPAIDRTKEQGAVLIYIFFAVGVAVGVDMLGTYSNCLGHSLSSGTPSFGWDKHPRFAVAGLRRGKRWARGRGEACIPDEVGWWGTSGLLGFY